LALTKHILALSDPPYYTACPNPFIDEFCERNTVPHTTKTKFMAKSLFTSDVSEGKNDPIYNAHSYHTKVPHKAIMRYILHYTKPGDLVFDGFCGTGMTGVAAQLCGDSAVVTGLGYRVEADGTILALEKENDRDVWRAFSKLGPRRAILNDLSPAATFIAYNYNTPQNIFDFASHVKELLAEVEAECGWMYDTLHTDEKSGRINYTIWSDVFTCPQCAGEIVFWDAAINKESGQVLDDFPCPHCSSELTKRGLERAWVTKMDHSIKQQIRQVKQVPVLINYSVGTKRFEKSPDAEDLSLIKKIDAIEISAWLPTDRMMDGGETRRNDPTGVTHVHHFYTRRNLIVLATFLAKIKPGENHLRQFLYGSLRILSKQAKHNKERRTENSGLGWVNAGVTGTLYISSCPAEQNVLFFLKKRISKYYIPSFKARGNIIFTGSTNQLALPSCSIDYLFFDPPFGANLTYSELNFLNEAWLGLFTNVKQEAIEDKSKGKTLNDYRRLMTECFREAFRVLKPGRWMTVEFSNTQASVWNAIQIALQEAGFVVANVSALDKKQGSFKAVTTTTAVKQDLVISAYKPNGGLEDRFSRSGGSEDSVWDFTRTHLHYACQSLKVRNGALDFIAERDPRIIFDRMVAWFVRHNTPVPMSTHEFQAGLIQRFVERDGMVFLPEQVAEYDKKRHASGIAPQMEMFVSDERSAIDWLTDFLKRRPSTYQEIHPTSLVSLVLAGRSTSRSLNWPHYWKITSFSTTVLAKSQPDHSYLSSNHKDQRNLDKNDPALIAKAKDRWYVPDPNKAQDLEKKREKALLKGV
jgi:rubredoxin